MTETLTCDICGKPGAKLRHLTRSYGKGETRFVIENVPVLSCPHSGDSYLTAETLHEFERIKLQRHTFAASRTVPLPLLARPIVVSFRLPSCLFVDHPVVIP